MKSRALVLSLLMLPAIGCGETATEIARGSSDTPVILISVDTLRSDRLPAYGYEKIETPAIDSLRADGVLYESAYAHCPLTFPSHSSMFTGLLPADNGIRDNVGYRLGDEHVTIAEVLGQNGYATGAAVSAYVLRRDLGVAQGFDVYDDDVEAIGPSQVIGRIQRVGQETVDIAKEWIGQNGDKPFFYFLHLYDPHTPYSPPAPFDSKYDDAYDNEIAYVDSVLGDFLQYLKDAGVYDDALIIFLSDHGEGLWEHGEEEHGIFLYREAIQIPLIVKLPDSAAAGTTVSSPAQIIDLFPTIAQQTATDVDLSGLDGMSLVDLIESPPAEPRMIYSESYYPKFHFGWSDLHSLTNGEHHYIKAPTEELYDLAADFGETENILDQERRVYFSMRDGIEPLVREAAAPAPVDPEEAAKLAALGYLGSTVKTEPGEALPDPKDKIDSFREIKIAFTMFHNEKYDQALEKIDSLLADNPRMLDLWDLRSKILNRLGRNREAIAAAREGLRLVPNAHHLMLMVANLSLDLEDLDEAQAHAELALAAEPGQANEVLARVAIERGNLDEAERLIRTALEHDDENVTTLMTLGRLQNVRGQQDQALATMDRALRLISGKKNREVTNLHFIRGDILARMGRVEEAEREFRQEIDLFPAEPHAYKNLVLLLVTQGRMEEATALLRQLIDTAPTPRSYVAVCRTLDVLGDQRGVRYWARQGLEKFPNEMELRRYLSG